MAKLEPEYDCTAPLPVENPDLTGHEAAERALLDAYNSGRLPHAWLITGPRGIGKATLAYRFARFVMAQGGQVSGGLFGEAAQPDSLYTDPANPVFQRVASGGHADLMVIEKREDPKTGKMSSVIAVKDVRDAGSFLHLTPAEGGWRVVTVDSADDMNASSANAILKILEEPPRQSLLLLVSHNPGRLLPTIRSRCRKLALHPLGSEAVAGLCGRYLPGISPDDAGQLARLSEGSIGRANELAEAGGLEYYAELMGLLEGLPELDTEALHGLAEKLGRAGAEDAFRMTAHMLRWWLGKLVVSSAKGEAIDPLMDRLGRLVARDRWLDVWESSGHLLARVETAYLDRRQVTLNLFLAIQGAAR